MNIEQLLELFTLSSTVTYQEVAVQALLLLLLSCTLSAVYYWLGNALSNRARLAAVLPFMALTTMLIISVIKSSLALSLGLVGALSIVRFRAAIKDPEELAYIFLSIALGLGFGADQVTITVLFYVIIVALIVAMSLLRRWRQGALHSSSDTVHLEIQWSKPQELERVSQTVSRHARELKLTRFDQGNCQTMMFLMQPKSVAALDSLRSDIAKLDSKAEVHILQYQPLV